MTNKNIVSLTAASVPLAGTEVIPLWDGAGTKKTSVASILGAGTSLGAFTAVNVWTAAGVSPYLSLLRSGSVETVLHVPSGGANVLAVSLNPASKSDAALLAGDVLTLSVNGLSSTGNFIPSTAGKGINFTANTPAAGMTSQLLNWYEEGTCTIHGALATPGTSSTAFTYGQYVRIGRGITVNCFLAFDKGTGTGTFTLTGLPFATANNSIRTPVTLRCDGIGATSTILQGDVASNSTVINLMLANQSTTNGSAVTDGSMSSTIYISVSLSYQV